MTSIFDLKTEVSQLETTNEGTSKMMYEQMPPTRSVQNENFANGDIHFRWEVSGDKWWMPSQSYLRTRFTLTNGNNQPIDLSDDVAPNMALMANLFQSAEFRINDTTVSRVSDFMAQVDTLDKRLTKSSSWLDTVGNSTNFWQESFTVRQAEASSDGEIQTPITGVITIPDTSLGTYTALTTVAYVAATGVVTLAGAGGNTEDSFDVGDSIFLTGSGQEVVDNVSAKILATTDGDTMTVEAVWPANIVSAGGIRFFRTIPTVDGVSDKARNVGKFELIWTPPLSIYKITHALPTGRYELILRPHTASAFQQRCIESLSANKLPILQGQTPTADQFKVNVDSMFLYNKMVHGERMDNITYMLDLEQTRCQSQKIDGEGFAQKNFDVSPSTYALTVAYQDLRAGNDTRISASKFKSYNATAPFVEQELALTRMFVNFSGSNKPQPDADPTFVAGTDNTTQRWADTQMYSGGMHDTGGTEDIRTFHERGSYYYWLWPRDGTDRSTRVNVHSGFATSTDVANMRVLLFDHSRQVARIRIQDGRVTDVQLEDS